VHHTGRENHSEQKRFSGQNGLPLLLEVHLDADKISVAAQRKHWMPYSKILDGQKISNEYPFPWATQMCAPNLTLRCPTDNIQRCEREKLSAKNPSLSS